MPLPPDTRDGIDALFEVHYQDLWPEAFTDMIKRYRAQARRGGDLYVNFTSRPDASDPLDRTAYNKPDHRDMVGTYAYPLWYVVKHPADLWYGFNAEFARVLRDTSRNKLYLSSLNESDALQVLYAAFGGVSAREQYQLAYKYFKDMRHYPAKLMLAALQYDLSAGRGSYSGDKFMPGEKTGFTWQYKQRTGAEQTALFRKAGIDAVEDDPTRVSQAVINDREPHQICFLNRHAFKVEETVTLGKRGLYRTSRSVSTTFNFDHYERKTAEQIAEILGDKLKGGARTANLGGLSRFYTTSGRVVEIDVQDTSASRRMSTLKIGGKENRAYTTKTPHSVDITVHTEYGNLTAKVWSDERTQQGIDSIAIQWAKLNKDVPKYKWKPRTKKSDEDDEKSERLSNLQKRMEIEAENEKGDSQKYLDRWNAAAKAAGVTGISVSPDTYQRYLQYRRLMNLVRTPDLPIDVYNDNLHGEVRATKRLIDKAKELGVNTDERMSVSRFLQELEQKLSEPAERVN